MEKVLKIIQDNASRTGNRCGISPVQVSTLINLPIEETLQILNQICATKKAVAREGIHGPLFFAINYSRKGAGPTRSFSY